MSLRGLGAVSTGPDLPVLSEAEWVKLRDLLHEMTGISLGPAKKVLLVTRLDREMNRLGMHSFSEYYGHLVMEESGSRDRQAFVNALTTNKTEFFREAEHFEILAQRLRDPEPWLVRSLRRGLRVWCAASSTGEEPYTLAYVLASVLDRSAWVQSQVTATDIDTRVLAQAARAVYGVQATAAMAREDAERLFVRGTGRFEGQYRVRKALRQKVTFRQYNLTRATVLPEGPFDVIFLRNVLIYFERATQQRVVASMARQLVPGGLLFLGHSESLLGDLGEFQAVAHTVYQRRNPEHGASLRPRASLGARRLPGCSLAPPAVEAAPTLPVGSQVSGGTGWVTAELDAGFLLVLIQEAGRRVVAMHERAPSSPKAASETTKGCLSWLRAILASLKDCEGVICARLVGAPSRVPQCVDSEREGISYVGDRVMEWLKPFHITMGPIRVFHEPTLVRLDLSAGRLLAEQKSGKTSGPERFPHVTMGHP